MLKADGKYDLDAFSEGSLKTIEETRFKAKNDRFNFDLNPNSQSNKSGQGVISFNDKVNLIFFIFYYFYNLFY